MTIYRLSVRFSFVSDEKQANNNIINLVYVDKWFLLDVFSLPSLAWVHGISTELLLVLVCINLSVCQLDIERYKSWIKMLYTNILVIDCRHSRAKGRKKIVTVKVATDSVQYLLFSQFFIHANQMRAPCTFTLQYRYRQTVSYSHRAFVFFLGQFRLLDAIKSKTTRK